MTRVLHPASPPLHGADVTALQALLHVPADGIYGTQTATAVYRRKVELGYAHPDHSSGGLLLEYLTGKKHPSPAMVARAKKNAGKTTPPGSSSPPSAPLSHEDKVRAAIAYTWRYLIANAEKVHYPTNDVRTTEGIHLISTMAELEAINNSPQGLTADCSQTVSLVSHVSGAKCPDGEYAAGWKADGYTGTLLAGCERITKAQAKVGDPHVYGGGTGHHVAQKIGEQDGDALMGSHGHNPPELILDNTETSRQPAGGAWLRLPI